jgi:hypothetical protein
MTLIKQKVENTNENPAASLSRKPPGTYSTGKRIKE